MHYRVNVKDRLVSLLHDTQLNKFYFITILFISLLKFSLNYYLHIQEHIRSASKTHYLFQISHVVVCCFFDRLGDLFLFLVQIIIIIIPQHSYGLFVNQLYLRLTEKIVHYKFFEELTPQCTQNIHVFYNTMYCFESSRF